jgi:CBS-domain-containing membrane protein
MQIVSLLGIESSPVSHKERALSAIGGLVAILLVALISHFTLADSSAHFLIVASMGASAVLLFAVPHGALSQPWPVFGGHLVSALAGVVIGMAIPNDYVAAPLAVGLAIGAMHYARCIHPPGGATALTAVIGGPGVQALGFGYVLNPVLANVVVMLAVALVFNYPFAWRRYPVALARYKRGAAPATDLTHADIAYAMQRMGSFIDITEEDLTRIYALAHEHADSGKRHPEDIGMWRYYSNGRYGPDWQVRRIIDEETSGSDPAQQRVIYRVVAGPKRRFSAVCTRAEFANWARYEVIRNENSWQRVEPQAEAPADTDD